MFCNILTSSCLTSSTIIEAVKEICQVSSDRKLAYFYFDFQKVGEQDDDILLRCILRQLCAGEAKIPNAVQELYAKHIQLGHQPSKAELESTLFAVIAGLGKEIYIILDALDEIPAAGESKRERVLQQIEKLVRDRSDRIPNLHVLATSRNEPDIRQVLEPLCDACISIQSAWVEVDIRKYVSTCLEENCFRKLGQDIKGMIEKELAQQADGMFRWAFCQIDALRQCKSPRAIKTALKTLPKTLDDTYERILIDMASQDAEEARRLLPWLLHSERPLTLEEVAEAAVLRPESLPVDPDDRLFDPHDVLRICRGLIILSRENVSINSSSRDHGVIRFSHFSVKEYLISGRSKIISTWQTSGHEYIARCCVSSLLQLDFPKLKRRYVKKNPLLKYAAQYWPAHVRQIEEEQRYEVLDDVYRLLERGSLCLLNWVRLYDPVSRLQACLSLEQAEVAPSLFYASLLGLCSTAKKLVANGANVNAKVEWAGTPLHGAAEFGSREIVGMLLEHGAAVNVYSRDKGTPLEVAVRRGHEDVVRALLQGGADANARVHGDATYTSILQASISDWRLPDVGPRVAVLLMDHGADVNTPGGGYSTALALACGWGIEALVLELLHRGAEVNTEGYFFQGTALEQAAAGGHARIVRTLLRAGADANAPGSGFYLSALEAAASAGSIEAVEWLLEWGADVNATGGGRGSALQAAAASGYNKVLIRLIEAGADIDVQEDRHGQSALLKAAEGGHRETVQLLLEAGADIHLQSDNGDSALLKAAYKGHHQTVQVLLESGADVDMQSDSGDSALMKAAYWGHHQTVQLLLERGADVNLPSDDGKSTLLKAADGGHRQAVQLLLGAGADVNLQSDDGETALLKAANWGYDQVVQLLLDAGADVNAPASQVSGSPLQAAAERGHVDVVRQLLQAGADVDAQAPMRDERRDPACGSPLQAASRKGHIEVVRLLIDAGADVNARHADCGTALGAALRHNHHEIAELLRSSGARELEGEEAGWSSEISSTWESGLDSGLDSGSEPDGDGDGKLAA